MSEQAPERPARGKRENVFTRKIGPLPMWVWVVIVGGAILAYSFYKNKTAGSTSTSATGTSAADVPQFVNQTYVNTTAPVSTPPTTGNPQSPPPFHIPGPVHAPHPPPRTPPPGPSIRSERLRHKGNLEQIAKRNGIDLEDLLEANPELQKYKGSGKQLPVGTVVRIPPAST